MDLLTGLIIGLGVVMCGFIALHAYAAWSIRHIDRHQHGSSPHQSAIQERGST